MCAPPDLGICTPVLNERESIGPLLDRVCERLSGARWTMCLVDDGSTDGTLEVVRARMERVPNIHLLHGRKEGPGSRRGRASREGLEWLLGHTGHPVFVDLDADGSQRPDELPAGYALVSSGLADVVVASKYVAGSRVRGRPLARRIGSRAFSGLLALLIRRGIRDYSNSYRFFTRRAAQALLAVPVRYDGPVYLVEMLAIWLSNGYRVTEIPTVYEPRAGGESKVTARDVFIGAAGALDVAFGFQAGRYRIPSGPAS